MASVKMSEHEKSIIREELSMDSDCQLREELADCLQDWEELRGMSFRNAGIRQRMLRCHELIGMVVAELASR